MPLTHHLVTGLVTLPGTDLGIEATLLAEPLTKNQALSHPGERTTYGPAKATTNTAGEIQGEGFKIPAVPGVVWRLRVVPKVKYDGLSRDGWTVGDYEITSSQRWDQLVETEPLAVTPDLVESVSTFAVRAENAAAAAEQVGAIADEQVGTSLAGRGLPTTGADLSASYVVFRDQNGAPLPPGSVTTITVNTVTGDIDDITFQEA